MSRLYLVPSLELSPMGDDEFGPSTKYGMPRKITQKLPRRASRLPVLEVSRPHLLHIKVSSWNGLSSETGAASDPGSAERRPPPPGHVSPAAHLSHPPAPSPLPLGPSPRGAQRLSAAFLYGKPASCPLLSPVSLLQSFQQMAGTTSQLTRAPRLHKLLKKQRAHTLGPHSLSSNPCSAIPGRGVLGRPLTFSGKGDGEGAQLHSITGEAEELKLLVDWVGGRGKHKMRAVCRLGRKAQDDSCALGFIWGKMRARAWETAPQLAQGAVGSGRRQHRPLAS